MDLVYINSIKKPKFYLLDKPEITFNIEQLKKLGILYFELNPQTYDRDGSLSKIMSDLNYGHKSIVILKEGKLPNFENKLKEFFEEHIHDHEEIRFVLEGCGYFDVRDHKDRWIRLFVESGDLIVLPSGILHRFSLDESRYAKVMRLFPADIEPIWIAHNRVLDETRKMDAYKKYQEFLKDIKDF